MRVLLRASVLESAGADRIFALFEYSLQERHDVLIHPNARGAWERWLGSIDAPLADIYRRAEEDSQKRQAFAESALVIIDCDSSSNWDEPWTLTIEDATSLLRLPLKIGVEDTVSDGLFLDTVVPKPLESRWKDLRDRDVIELVNLGGITNAPRRIKALCDKAERHRRRTLYIIDSDAPKPWREPDELERNTRLAIQAAKESRVEIRVLRRRMAENYLPPKALHLWIQSLRPNQQTGRREHAAAFSRLSPKRRYHHHLKKGTSSKEEALYADESLSEDERTSLRQGLGGDTYRAFEHATESMLREDGVHAEVEELFHWILKRA